MTSTVRQPKTVTIQGYELQLRKLSAAEGSFIYMRLMGALFKANSEREARPARRAESAKDDGLDKLTPEERVRVLCASGFMHMGHDDFVRAQGACMRVVSRVESLGGNPTPMPLVAEVAANGDWFPAPGQAEIVENAATVHAIVVEVLVDSLSCFFSEPVKTP
jgi:hypothetical protein